MAEKKKGLASDSFKRAGSSKPLWEEIKEVQKLRNDVMHRAEIVLKEKAEQALDYFKKNPALTKAQRSNMELYNKKFKEPFESGNNLLKKERVLGRLNTQFSGKVEWFLENEVVT